MHVCLTHPRLTMQSCLARKNNDGSNLRSHSGSGRRIRSGALLKCTRVQFPQTSRVAMSETGTTRSILH